MRALILCDGEPPSLELLAQHRAQADTIICTDGALHWVQAMGCRPDVLIGDLNSAVAPEGLAAGSRSYGVGASQPCERLSAASGCEVVDCGAHDQQNNTDAEKALLWALEHGATRIVFLGATGMRLDHTLGNVWLVGRYHDRAEIVLADDYGEMRVTSGHLSLNTVPGQLVSLMALTADVTLDTEGLRWALHEGLEQGTRGLSNEATGAEVVVDVHTGLVAVITPTVR